MRMTFGFYQLQRTHSRTKLDQEVENVKKVNDQEVEKVDDQEIENVKDQEIKNVEDQEIKNVKNKNSRMLMIKRAKSVKDEEIKNVEDQQVYEADDDTNDDKEVESSILRENESQKGLVGDPGEGLGVLITQKLKGLWVPMMKLVVVKMKEYLGNKRHIMIGAEEQELQDGLKRVKTAYATGKTATTSHDDEEGENQENPKLNEEVKYDKTGNKRRFMTEEKDEQQEGSKRVKNEITSAATKNNTSTGLWDRTGGTEIEI
ncbi:hypothetical protein Tco_0665200 [Tanacetum coccineum]